MSEKCEGGLQKTLSGESGAFCFDQVAMNMLLFSNCNYTCFIILHFMTKFSCSVAFLSQKLFIRKPRLEAFYLKYI